MPAIAAVLKTLIETKVDAGMAGITVPGVSYSGPLAQTDPSYYIEMCTAVATGIASATTFAGITDDTGFVGVPVVAGAGASVGIQIDAAYFEETMYTTIRDFTIADFGSTSHPVYASAPSDNFLKVFCKGIAEAVEEHFLTAWAIASVHPDVYAGTAEIAEGNFSGLSASGIESVITATAPRFVGPFWPRKSEAIAASYVDTIHNHSTNLVTIPIVGVCIPAVLPAPPQACNIPGTGNGTAVIS